MKKNIHYLCILIAFTIFTLSSCVDAKKLAYYNNITRDTTTRVEPYKLETKISKNDILQITITTLDEASTRILNSAGQGGGQGVANGYLVDDSGVIKLPLIGPVKAEGLTKAELASSITSIIETQKYAKSPIVTVRITNYKITIWGEVSRPGILPVPNEHITLPEALAAVGDLTMYGRRNNVLLIREKNGERTYKRFSLNNEQMFDKDIYNLQNQDIIYVEPNNAKAATSDRSTQLIPLGFSAVSLLITLYVLFTRN